MKNDEQPSKIGDGHAAAMLRQGLRELRAAMYQDSTIAQQPEYGLYGTLTPSEISNSRGESLFDRDAEQESVLADRMEQAEARAEPERDEPELERD